MKRWQKALLFSVIWVVGVIGSGILVTDVVLAGKITPQQDEQISEMCGMTCGAGVVPIWVFVFWRKRPHRG